MLADLPYTLLREAVPAQPTMAEGLGSLFAAVSASAPVAAWRGAAVAP